MYTNNKNKNKKYYFIGNLTATKVHYKTIAGNNELCKYKNVFYSCRIKNFYKSKRKNEFVVRALFDKLLFHYFVFSIGRTKRKNNDKNKEHKLYVYGNLGLRNLVKIQLSLMLKLIIFLSIIFLEIELILVLPNEKY